MKKHQDNYKQRLLLLGLVLLAGYSIITVKLWFEQIRRGPSHQKLISRQSVRRIRIPAKRGKIFTSDMHILADNEPEYSACFYLAEMRRPGSRKKTIDYIQQAITDTAASVNRPSTISRQQIIQHMNLRPGLPFTVFRDLNPREIAGVFQTAMQYDGIAVVPDNRRIYPAKDVAAHIIGFTRNADPQSAKDRGDFFYYVPDPQGKSGLEKAFDDFDIKNQIRGLRGEPGYRLVQVDHRGFIHKTLIDDIQPLDGNNIILTLDWKSQSIAQKLLDKKRGAFVLLDASTGAVLAMASSPSYDLGKFSPRLKPEDYRALLNNPDKPLINRTLQGQYAPGSIIKPLIGLALSASGMSPTEEIYCNGASTIAGVRIRCASWRRGGHGTMNLISALKYSCNDYFIENGCRIGLEPIITLLDSAGIGHDTGIELPEQTGLLPSRSYKLKHYGTPWNEYDTALLSIGQGIILLTPLQAAVYCAALANNGIIMRPHLLKEVRDTHGSVLYQTAPQTTGTLACSPENLKIIERGMFKVVNETDGSGSAAANNTITLYGKTGTAERGPAANRIKDTWFIAYGSLKGKTYAVAVMIEDAQSGGRSCAPIVSEFFTRRFGNPDT